MSGTSSLKRGQGFQKYISQFPVRVRILALVLVPLMGLLFVGFQELNLEYSEAETSSQALKLTEQIPGISALIHEVQKERGMSAGFISSTGQKFGSELNAQRRLTDASLESLRAGVENLKQMGIESETIVQLTRALNAFNELGTLRGKVSGLQVSASDSGSYYTGTIAELLGAIELQISRTNEPSLVQRLRAVNNLLQAKERAGIERAIGAEVFSDGEINVAEFAKFIGTIQLQDYLLEDFSKEAGGPLVALYERTLTGPVVDKFNAYRDILMRGPFGGSLTSVTGEQWFTAASDRIDLLKKIDDAATAEIVVSARNTTDAFWQKLWLSSAINAGILLLTGILAFVVVRSITGPLNRLTRTMGNLTEGSYDVEVADTENGDLLGQMARAVEIFRQNGLKVLELEKATAGQLVVAADHGGQIEAISKAQAIIEFTVEGDVLHANENFLAATGYTIEEIKGRHHSIFVDPDFVKSADYKLFWQKLGRGEYDEGEYERFGRGGKRIWLQASYNPIVGPDGQLTKVVKYATDVTPRKDAMEILDKGLKKLAEGDLMSRINSPLSGEFEEVRTAFNHTVDRLTDIVSQLRGTSGALKTATGEILAGANDLSERTTKQAATVEETSATMEQLSGTVVASAAQADDASTRSLDLAKTAEETGSVVQKATQAMERISTSSAKISNVIGMIDDIAFQTNLLALNASVEAARAGEAGKGFAVVAVEVRRLAQSAAEASSEVKELVEQSAHEVGTGGKFVASAAERLQSMIEGIQENSTLMQNLATTSREQASSIEEVNAAVRQMDEMTQHNAALVEETNAAIEQTDNQVVELDRIVDVFKLEGENGGAGARHNAPATRGDARALQGQAKQAAKSYLSEGSAAVDSEWAEF